ncbi:hypothetical protein ACGFXB_29625 [Streptomyces canus]|uniref:hypothetical protein n=1 Tax=Streptomyces canus TaxID=58343 RepID=UPI0037192617
MPSGKQAASAPFTPLDFQLVLLRRMADHNPGLVEDARHALGVSIADMREANKRWQAMVRSPPRSNELARGHPHRARTPASRYRSILGAPETVLTRKVGDLECEAWLWSVPLWPDLRFEALLAPNGSTVWNEWLIRAPEAEGPALRTLDDLTPWSCTVDEAARAFPPARPLEGTAPTRWGLRFTAPDEQGVRREVVAEFTWGLLQRFTVR